MSEAGEIWKSLGIGAVSLSVLALGLYIVDIPAKTIHSAQRLENL